MYQPLASVPLLFNIPEANCSSGRYQIRPSQRPRPPEARAPQAPVRVLVPPSYGGLIPESKPLPLEAQSPAAGTHLQDRLQRGEGAVARPPVFAVAVHALLKHELFAGEAHLLIGHPPAGRAGRGSAGRSWHLRWNRPGPAPLPGLLTRH